MPAIFPVIEGTELPDFAGNHLSDHYDELIEIAQKGNFKSINDFEYFDEDMIEDFGIEFEEEQIEWHSISEGIEALKMTIQHPELPADEGLRDELESLISILQGAPATSKGWRLQQDI